MNAALRHNQSEKSQKLLAADVIFTLLKTRPKIIMYSRQLLETIFESVACVITRTKANMLVSLVHILAYSYIIDQSISTTVNTKFKLIK